MGSHAPRTAGGTESMHVGDQITVRAKGQENRSKTPEKPLTLFWISSHVVLQEFPCPQKRARKPKPVRNQSETGGDEILPKCFLRPSDHPVASRTEYHTSSRALIALYIRTFTPAQLSLLTVSQEVEHCGSKYGTSHPA